MSAKPRKWIQAAVKHKGVLRKRLKELGLVKGERKITITSLKKVATGAYGPKTAKRARLALTLRKLRKR